VNKDAMDVDAAETIAGVVRLLRRAAVLAWAAADRAGAGSARQLFALGVNLAADQARHLVPVDTDIDGPLPVGDDPAGLLTSASLLLVGSRRPACRRRCSICRPPWPTWCGRRTPVSALDRRSVGELTADSDLLAREALLDMSADRALGVVREWPQLIKSAAELWAILPPEPTVPANGDPMAILAAMGSALRHSLAAGHWPGQGPTDESWEQIAANFTQARRLLQGQPVASEAISTPGPNRAHHRQHAGTARFVSRRARHPRGPAGYERDLQRRLEVGARRRQPLLERPTALEVESVRGMMARFDAIEQLTAASVGARRMNTADQPATGRHRPATRLGTALAAWKSKRTGHSPTTLTRPTWSGSPACRRSSPQPLESSAKPPRAEARSTPS
jgi:hypothetical protein